MRYSIWPFYSQHDKRSDTTIMTTCGATKQMDFIAQQLLALGHEVTVAVPWVSRYFYDGCHQIEVRVPLHNPSQRIHWDIDEIASVFAGCDVALCNHEFMAIPVRTLCPATYIVQMCATKPEPIKLFQAAWACADLTVFHSHQQATRLDEGPYSIWPMAYDQTRIAENDDPRDIDVLFVQRCSASNYTHHLEFLGQMPQLDGLNVQFTDVTNYLRDQRPDLTYSTDYYRTLRRTKVAVALNNDLFGGQAIREAIVSGCIPVVRNCGCYRELCGRTWPYVTELSGIARTIRRALNDVVDCSIPYNNAKAQSYQGCWPIIKEDLRA